MSKADWKDSGATERRSQSFLVRLWREPREFAGEGVAVRAYVRNLQSGEEHYLADPAAVGELLERSLEGAAGGAGSGQAPAVKERPG